MHDNERAELKAKLALRSQDEPCEIPGGIAMLKVEAPKRPANSVANAIREIDIANGLLDRITADLETALVRLLGDNALNDTQQPMTGETGDSINVGEIATLIAAIRVGRQRTARIALLIERLGAI